MDESQISEMFKGIFVSNVSGAFYVKVFFDQSMSPELLSSFIAGLSMFGRETVGHIDEILIKGLNLEIFVVTKHGLILTAIFSSDMPKIEIKKEAEQVLDMFQKKYGYLLNDHTGCVDDFCEFEKTIKNQISEYFQTLGEKRPKGFWQKILSFL